MSKTKFLQFIVAASQIAGGVYASSGKAENGNSYNNSPKSVTKRSWTSGSAKHQPPSNLAAKPVTGFLSTHQTQPTATKPEVQVPKATVSRFNKPKPKATLPPILPILEDEAFTEPESELTGPLQKIQPETQTSSNNSSNSNDMSMITVLSATIKHQAGQIKELMEKNQTLELKQKRLLEENEKLRESQENLQKKHNDLLKSQSTEVREKEWRDFMKYVADLQAWNKYLEAQQNIIQTPYNNDNQYYYNYVDNIDNNKADAETGPVTNPPDLTLDYNPSTYPIYPPGLDLPMSSPPGLTIQPPPGLTLPKLEKKKTFDI